MSDGTGRAPTTPPDDAPPRAEEVPDPAEADPRPATPPHEGWLSPRGSILLIGGLAIGGIVLMFVTVLVLLLLSLSD